MIKQENKANIDVYSDCDCNIFKAGEVIATVPEGGCSVIKLKQGRHLIICQSSQFPDIEQKERIEVSNELADDFIEIKLADKVQERKKRKDNKLKEWWEKNKRKFGIALAVIFAIVILIGLYNLSSGETETQAETAVEEIELSPYAFENIKTLKGYTETVYSVSYSPDRKNIVSGSGDRTIKIWDANTGKCLKTLEGHECAVYSISYSPDGKNIVSGSADKTIKIWEANTGKCLKTLWGHKDYVSSVSYSPDGNYIVSGSWDNTIKIWDANTGECLKTLKGHSYSVHSVSYSPDGKRIISGSSDKTIKIWGAE